MVRVSQRAAEAAEKAAVEAASAASSQSEAPKKTAAPRKGLQSRGANVNKKAPVVKKAAVEKKVTKVTKTTTTKVTAAAAKKAAVTKKSAPVAAKKSVAKRANADSENEEEPAQRPVKKARNIAPARAAKPVKELPVLTSPPKETLNVLMFGGGENGELGLGPAPNCKEVKRPRLNEHLDIKKVGIVDVALGGMHGLALTKDGKVYSWGVNDLQALGRDTKADEKVREIANDSDSDDEVEEGMNKLESTPMEVTGFPAGTVITRIAAGDSISLAVANTGKVYGWGTFRAADGVLGFSETVRVQDTPAEIPELKNIVSAVCGTDHAIVLDNKGIVYAWGNGQQNQLGRRVIERTRVNGLKPRPINIPGRKKIASVYSGHYHAFAVDIDGQVWAWGLNSYGQTGIYDDNGTDSLLTIPKPMVIEKLKKYKVAHIASGQCHTVVITGDGDLLCWGRMDAHQAGVTKDNLGEHDIIKDVAGKDRILITPTKISNEKFVTAACGTEHSIAIAADGSAWSWGFGESYQVGQGPPSRDIEVPTKIVNTQTKQNFFKTVGCGGNFSCLAGTPRQTPLED